MNFSKNSDIKLDTSLLYITEQIVWVHNSRHIGDATKAWRKMLTISNFVNYYFWMERLSSGHTLRL